MFAVFETLNGRQKSSTKLYLILISMNSISKPVKTCVLTPVNLPAFHIKE